MLARVCITAPVILAFPHRKMSQKKIPWAVVFLPSPFLLYFLFLIVCDRYSLPPPKKRKRFPNQLGLTYKPTLSLTALYSHLTNPWYPDPRETGKTQGPSRPLKAVALPVSPSPPGIGEKPESSPTQPIGQLALSELQERLQGSSTAREFAWPLGFAADVGDACCRSPW